MLHQVRRHQVEVARSPVRPRRQNQDVGGADGSPNCAPGPGRTGPASRDGRRGNGHHRLGDRHRRPERDGLSRAGGDVVVGPRRTKCCRSRRRARTRPGALQPPPPQTSLPPTCRVRACLPPGSPGVPGAAPMDSGPPQDRLPTYPGSRRRKDRSHRQGSRAVAVPHHQAFGHEGPEHPLAPVPGRRASRRRRQCRLRPPARNAVPRPDGHDPAGPSRRTGTGQPRPRPSPGPGPGRAARQLPTCSDDAAGRPDSRAPGWCTPWPRGRGGPGRMSNPGPGAPWRPPRPGPPAAAATSLDGPGQHPARRWCPRPHVAPEGERQDGPCGVGPHPGKGQQVGEVVGHLAVVPLHHGRGGQVEVPRPTVVPHALPGPEDVAERRGGTARRGRERGRGSGGRPGRPGTAGSAGRVSRSPARPTGHGWSARAGRRAGWCHRRPTPGLDGGAERPHLAGWSDGGVRRPDLPGAARRRHRRRIRGDRRVTPRRRPRRDVDGAGRTPPSRP